MKLDSIIYDQNTLANAIAEQWATESEVFNAMYPSDTATALVNGFAAYGSMLQYCLVSAMANCYISTAFSETGIYQLAETLGNILHGNEPASVTVAITKTNFLTVRAIIPANSRFSIKDKNFFNPHGIILPANNPTVTDIELVQGDWTEVNKTSNGIANEKFYFSTDFKASHNYTKVFVNGVEWKVVNSFLDYDKYNVLDITQMNAVMIKTDPDGNTYIRVGDGQLGTLPPSGSNITIQYVSNDGLNGNIQETNISGSLISNITLIDNEGKEDTLKVEVISTSTAFGGFNKQSIATLRYTSPWVFASGHRAIRRQDYNAILQNECGYLASSVWGEYEEADYVGAYDSLMMNMVYYTGLKSFENYDYFNIGELKDSTCFTGTLNTTKGFWGSYSLKFTNISNSEFTYFTMSDNNAHGTLYINNNDLDPRDSLLPEWLTAESTTGTVISLNDTLTDGIIAGGVGYKVNDILELYLDADESTSTIEILNTNIKVLVTEVDSTGGGVTKASLLTKYFCDNLLYLNGKVCFTKGNTEGSGCLIQLSAKIFAKPDDTAKKLVKEYLVGNESTATQNNPITNAMSNKSNEVFFKSIKAPVLTNPVQICLNYGDFTDINERGIVAIKFKPANSSNGPFIGTIAMFGWNKIDPFMPPAAGDYDNVRNSEYWDCIINRTYLENPINDAEDGWTDWISTNCFDGTKNQDGTPNVKKYKYFVIEFYSTESTTSTENEPITFSKMKILYDTDASFIYYNNNSSVNVSFPIEGSPGPDNQFGYLTDSLMNNETRNYNRNRLYFPLYKYNVQIEGANAANGYVTGNTLAYRYVSNNGNAILFIVNILNADNGLSSVKIDNKNALVGEENINLATPLSLDELKTYTLQQNNVQIIEGGEHYKVGDLVVVKDSRIYSNLSFRVNRVLGNGSVTSLIPLASLIVSEEFAEQGEYFYPVTENELYGENSPSNGLKILIKPKLSSAGSGATISISSESNIQVDASFIGNRIDTADINKFDQSIIEKYNHFTTYVEFKQPEIVQQEILAQVSITNSSTVSSSIVIQNVKNNLQKLFDITPDYMGKGLALSDIYKAILKTENVEWCKVLFPIDNVTIRKNQLLTCKDIAIQEVINTIK